MSALTNRVALVTGAGAGIGRAIALRLAGAGAFVGVHFNAGETGAEETLAAIRKEGGDGKLLKADLTNDEQAMGLVSQLTSQTKQLDILINNAGALLQRATIEDCSLDLWEKSTEQPSRTSQRNSRNWQLAAPTQSTWLSMQLCWTPSTPGVC